MPEYGACARRPGQNLKCDGPFRSEATIHPLLSVEHVAMVIMTPSKPAPILTTDSFGINWVPALLLEIRNGVARVQIGEHETVRPLAELRWDLAAPPFRERTRTGRAPPQ
jgi:hypothetical protein